MLTKEIIPILMYHDISNKINNHSVYYKKFFLQINLLNKLGYEAVNLCDLHKKTIKKKFVITFDDGYANIAKYVLPFLKKKNLKATCFIVTNSIGKFNDLHTSGPYILSPAPCFNFLSYTNLLFA